MRLLLLFAIMTVAIAAEDKSLEFAKERFKKEVEAAQQKRDAAVDKLDKEFAATKEKQTAILVAAYNDSIKRATMKGDLEAGNALLAERKALEGGKSPSTETPDLLGDGGKAKASGTSKRVEVAILGRWRLEKDYSGSYRQSFEFKPNGVVSRTSTYKSKDSNSQNTNDMKWEIKDGKIIVTSRDSSNAVSSDNAKHWYEIPLPLEGDTTTAIEWNKGDNYSNQSKTKLIRMKDGE